MIETTINDAPTMRDEAARNSGRLRPGDEILGRYVVEGELGQGGMGVVYKCLDKVGGVEVAVKGLPPEVSHNVDEMEEVRDNYRLVQGLRHPNICGIQILEKDARDDYYLVMDLAHGVNLNRWLRQHPEATETEKISILRQIASALDYAHARKIIHRDVKPENVMIADDGTVQVLDFGLAAQVRSGLSRTCQAVTSKSGTPGYKAPEQWQGRPQGPASDQYALGVIAYKLFAGFLPFDGDDIVVLGQSVLTAPVEPVNGTSDTVNAALAKALAKKPTERFPSCAAFVAALEGRTTSAGPQSAQLRNERRATSVDTDIYLVEADAKDLFEQKVAHAAEPTDPVLKNSFRRLRTLHTAASSALQHGDSMAARRLFADFTQSVADYESAIAEAARKAVVKRLSGVGVKAGEVQEMTLPSGVKMKFVWCPPGSFTMDVPTDEEGSDDEDENDGEYEYTQHRVTLTKGFWLGQFEVTQAQWRSVMGNNPSEFKGDDRPVDSVSWKDCQIFIAKCNAETKDVRFALPTEAQWEYACRAGSTDPYAGAGNLDEGWYYGNSGMTTHPVGQKLPNAWNLYDMHGNVDEWCADWYGKYKGDSTDPAGPASGGLCVFRGGCWFDGAVACGSAVRNGREPGSCSDSRSCASVTGRRVRNGREPGWCSNYYGFRLLCSAGPSEEARLAEMAREREEKCKAVDVRQSEFDQQCELSVKCLKDQKMKPGEVHEIVLPGGAKMKLVWCPPRTFMMGSPVGMMGNHFIKVVETGCLDHEILHSVTLTKGFWLGQFEVTQAQWRSVMGDNPSHFKGDDNRPVESVSWEDCQKFIEKCNAAAKGVRFALPTEAQWEYACRAGSTGPYAGTGRLDKMGWYDGNSGGKTHPVGQKQPNAWNLYDMHGNVWEWCSDCYGSYEGDCTDPMGPASGGDRVLRGGCWSDDASICRSAFRGKNWPGFRNRFSGFRLLCSAGPHGK